MQTHKLRAYIFFKKRHDNVEQIQIQTIQYCITILYDTTNCMEKKYITY